MWVKWLPWGEQGVGPSLLGGHSVVFTREMCQLKGCAKKWAVCRKRGGEEHVQTVSGMLLAPSSPLTLISLQVPGKIIPGKRKQFQDFHGL